MEESKGVLLMDNIKKRFPASMRSMVFNYIKKLSFFKVDINAKTESGSIRVIKQQMLAAKVPQLYT